MEVTYPEEMCPARKVCLKVNLKLRGGGGRLDRKPYSFEFKGIDVIPGMD
jgi:hypothetical protein